MSASMVRATVRAVSKRKILPARAALTLVSFRATNFLADVGLFQTISAHLKRVAVMPRTTIYSATRCYVNQS